MCARGFITVQNSYHAWVIFMTTHFLYPKIGVSAYIFENFSSLLKKRYFRQLFVKFLQQLNDYRENDLVLKLVDDFLASRYASLTTKGGHFVRSLTSRNLSQFQWNLVFLNQHEKFYLLMIFEGNLRWWVDWLGQLTENDPQDKFDWGCRARCCPGHWLLTDALFRYCLGGKQLMLF